MTEEQENVNRTIDFLKQTKNGGRYDRAPYTMPPASKEYCDGWDRIFGNKNTQNEED